MSSAPFVTSTHSRTPMPQLLELYHSLDPVAFARERLRFLPDPTQSIVLASRSNQVILNCTRQWGKSTLTAAQAVFTAWHEPESLILVMSPNMRIKVSLSGQDTYGAWREGLHDDLVLAAALACWRATRPNVLVNGSRPSALKFLFVFIRVHSWPT